MNKIEDFDFGESVDVATFEQILEMDDDDETREFSSSIVFGFLTQAQETFGHMDEAWKGQDLKELSSLGHFLKGSSATLGYTIIKDECEKIQHLGNQKDETGTVDVPDTTLCLRKIGDCIKAAKRDFKNVEKMMHNFFGTEG